MKTKIKKEIKSLIQRVKEGVTPYIVCPKCGRGQMRYGYYGIAEWCCAWRDCLYRTSDIPSIQEIKELIKLKENLKRLKDWKI